MMNQKSKVSNGIVKMLDGTYINCGGRLIRVQVIGVDGEVIGRSEHRERTITKRTGIPPGMESGQRSQADHG